MPEQIHMGHFMYVKMFQYIVEKSCKVLGYDLNTKCVVGATTGDGHQGLWARYLRKGGTSR